MLKIICILKEIKVSMEFLCNKGSYKMGLLTNSGKDIEKKHKMWKYLKTTFEETRTGTVKIKKTNHSKY